MMEVRGIIKSTEDTRKKIEELGGKLLGNYEFKDIIFSENENDNLSKDYLRLRCYSKTNWSTKNFVLVRKKTEFKEMGKRSNKIFKKEFDDEKTSIDYIKKHFPKFKEIVGYSREGWQYQLDKNKIFIENIKEYKPSIEIESENETELNKILKEVNTLDILKESMAETMRKIKK